MSNSNFVVRVTKQPDGTMKTHVGVFSDTQVVQAKANGLINGSVVYNPNLVIDNGNPTGQLFECSQDQTYVVPAFSGHGSP